MTDQERAVAKELERIKLEIRVLAKQLTGNAYLAALMSAEKIQEAIEAIGK